MRACFTVGDSAHGREELNWICVQPPTPVGCYHTSSIRGTHFPGSLRLCAAAYLFIDQDRNVCQPDHSFGDRPKQKVAKTCAAMGPDDDSVYVFNVGQCQQGCCRWALGDSNLKLNARKFTLQFAHEVIEPFMRHLFHLSVHFQGQWRDRDGGACIDRRRDRNLIRMNEQHRARMGGKLGCGGARHLVGPEGKIMAHEPNRGGVFFVSRSVCHHMPFFV